MTPFIFHYVWQSRRRCGCKSASSERDWADGWDHKVISFGAAETEKDVFPSAVLFSLPSQITC